MTDERRAREHYDERDSQLADAMEALDHYREGYEKLTQVLKELQDAITVALWTPSQSKPPHDPF